MQRGSTSIRGRECAEQLCQGGRSVQLYAMVRGYWEAKGTPDGGDVKT